MFVYLFVLGCFWFDVFCVRVIVMMFALFLIFPFCFDFCVRFVVAVCLALGYAQPRLRLLIRSWFGFVLFVCLCLCSCLFVMFCVLILVRFVGLFVGLFPFSLFVYLLSLACFCVVA